MLRVFATIAAAFASANVPLATLCSGVEEVSNNVLVTPANGMLCSNAHSSDERCVYDADSILGAEISGVTNFTALTDEEISVIRGALNKHKVVYFKNAAHRFTPDSQLKFAKRFGDILPDVSNIPKYVEKGVHQSLQSKLRFSDREAPLDMDGETAVASMLNANKPAAKTWNSQLIPDGVIRLVREPGDPFAFGEGLHADVTFFAHPPAFTFLVARQLPGGLDDTLFVDVGRAWRELPTHAKQMTAGLSAQHDDSAGMRAVHPAVRTHPETGEQALYVNDHFTHSLLGFSNAKSKGRALLQKLLDHVEVQPRFRFKWQGENPGDSVSDSVSGHVLMWDNRALQHSSTVNWALDPVLSKRRRELHRVTISHSKDAERPFYRPS